MERLPHPHGNGVLQLRPPHFQDAVEVFRLLFQRALQPPQLGQQRAAQDDDRELSRRGDYVVGGLFHIHVIVGMNARVIAGFAAQLYRREVRDHLVDVHVRARARAALHRVHHELLAVFARQYFVAGEDDRLRARLIQYAVNAVDERRGFFDQNDIFYERKVHLTVRDAEIPLCPQRLHAVIGVPLHLQFADGITLRAVCFFHVFILFVSVNIPIVIQIPPSVNRCPEELTEIFRKKPAETSAGMRFF